MMKKHERKKMARDKIKRLPKSIRKYIRQQKARIRKEVWDETRQKELIRNLYDKFKV